MDEKTILTMSDWKLNYYNAKSSFFAKMTGALPRCVTIDFQFIVFL